MVYGAKLGTVIRYSALVTLIGQSSSEAGYTRRCQDNLKKGNPLMTLGLFLKRKKEKLKEHTVREIK